jgi:flagellar motor switch protein FliN
MTTFLDCWIGVASTLLTQALAGEPEFCESMPKPFAGGSFAIAATVVGDQEGRFVVMLDAGVVEAPLLGEGVDQRAAWAELLKEVAEAAAGELLAKSGVKVSVEKVEEVAGEAKISRAFELKTRAGSWTVLVRDNVRAVKKSAEVGASKAGKVETEQTAKSVGGNMGAGAGAQSLTPGIDLLLDVELEATLRFGSRELPLGELLELGPGDVVQLDRHIADPVDLIVADKIVARGDVVLVNGNFGLRVTEVAEPRRRLETIRCLF